MQALKHKIYGNHLRRVHEQAEPCPYEDPAEDPNLDEQEEHRLRGFTDPRNTVAITVPICNEYGEEYGSRVDMIPPKIAGDLIDANRHEIASLREAHHEARFWQGFNARVAGLSIGLNVIFIVLMILAGRGC